MRKNIILLIALFCSASIKSQVFITEIFNNTDTEVYIEANTIKTSEILVSEPAGSMNLPGKVAASNTIFIPARTRYIAHNLAIPVFPLNDSEPQKEMNFFVRRNTESFNMGNWFMPSTNALLTLKQQGDLLSFSSTCGAVKSFNFLKEEHLPERHKHKVDKIAGEYLPENSTYSIEIKQLCMPVLIRKRRCKYEAYIRDSLEINFKKNEIDSAVTKSKLKNKYPVAQLVSFNDFEKPAAALIEFNKVVTQHFMHNFCEQVKNSELGKFIVLSPGIGNEKSLINFTIYKSITQRQIENIIDHINGLKLLQYDK